MNLILEIWHDLKDTSSFLRSIRFGFFPNRDEKGDATSGSQQPQDIESWHFSHRVPDKAAEHTKKKSPQKVQKKLNFFWKVEFNISR